MTEAPSVNDGRKAVGVALPPVLVDPHPDFDALAASDTCQSPTGVDYSLSMLGSPPEGTPLLTH